MTHGKTHKSKQSQRDYPENTINY